MAGRATVMGLSGLPAWADPMLGKAPGVGIEAALPMLSCINSIQCSLTCAWQWLWITDSGGMSYIYMTEQVPFKVIAAVFKLWISLKIKAVVEVTAS